MDISYFLFGLDHKLNAIKTEHVEEIFPLPELISVPEAPLGIVGVVERRGDMLPVFDLRRRPKDQQHYSLTDNVIVLSHPQVSLGIIANTVHGVRDLPSQGVTTELSDRQDWMGTDAKRFFSDKILIEDNTVILNEPEDWFSASEVQQVMLAASLLKTTQNQTHDSAKKAMSEEDPLTPQSAFCAGATPEEKRIFQQRAEELRRSLDEGKSNEASRSVVVIGLDEMLLGIDSQVVREFITVRQAVPVPCCPAHVIGNINLRGEILTLIDIRSALNISPQALDEAPKAIILEFEEALIGIVVEKIYDAAFEITLDNDHVSSQTPASINASYIDGAAHYNDRPLQVLNLSNLLGSPALVVDERV
ncbi:MAG: chemotaxis protein CheW [Elainellaceae cyanobacterium]